MRAFKSCFCLKNARKQLGIEDLTILASETLFTINEIEALYDMFKKLSSSIINDAFIQKEELLLALFRNSSKKNIFADRIFDLFDNKHNGVIDFEEFVRTMSIFHPNASEEDKIAFAFRLYDLRQTGYIEREEVILTKISETQKRCLRAVIKKLKEMVTAILSESDMTLSDDNIEYIVNKTIIEADLKDDGKIDQEEWKQLVMKNPSLIKNMTVPCLKEITLAFPNFVVNTEVPD